MCIRDRLVSIPFSWIYIYPLDLIEYSESILYSLGFGSNFYFHYSGLEYGSPESLLKPFLHTWSLSVEEQYYVLFPIILFAVFRYYRKGLFYFLLLINAMNICYLFPRIDSLFFKNLRCSLK